jgi:putative solute:sodium symporter small subunit
MNEVTGPFGYPWTYWFTCQGSLGIFVISMFLVWLIGKRKSMKNLASTKKEINNDKR